jgi:hypothetical protein
VNGSGWARRCGLVACDRLNLADACPGVLSRAQPRRLQPARSDRTSLLSRQCAPDRHNHPVGEFGKAGDLRELRGRDHGCEPRAKKVLPFLRDCRDLRVLRPGIAVVRFFYVCVVSVQKLVRAPKISLCSDSEEYALARNMPDLNRQCGCSGCQESQATGQPLRGAICKDNASVSRFTVRFGSVISVRDGSSSGPRVPG